MSLVIIVLLIMVLLFTSIMIGVFSYKKNKVLSMMLIVIPIIAMLVPFLIFRWISYNSVPNSLSINVKSTGDHYKVAGKWINRSDYYSYGQDIITFCFKQTDDYVSIELPSLEAQKDGILKRAEKELLSSDLNQNTSCSSYSIELSDQYEIPFNLGNDVHRNDVEIFYIHVVTEPMDSPTYWIKKLEWK
ncbi:hypothetical protein [Paenibacillus marinisediminis]